MRMRYERHRKCGAAIGWFTVAGWLGCGTVVPQDGEDESSSGSIESSEGSPTADSTSTDETTEDVSTGASESGDETASPTDTGEEPPACPAPDSGFACSFGSPECPEGTKCTAHDFDDDGEPDASSCRPAAAEPLPLYAECTPDSTTCVDPCGPSALCQIVGSDGTGVCIDVCTASDNRGEPTCPADDTTCVQCAACSVQPCLPTCDPLDPQCPQSLPVCYFSDQWGPICSVEATQADGPGAPCDGLATCPQGTACVPAEAYGAACEGEACCTPFCDLEDGEPGCTEAGQTCVTVDPTQPPGDLEGLGWCLSEDFDPCAEPGSCPPDAFDPQYPWCSTTNDAFCEGDSAFGFENDCVSQCWCSVPCSDDDDCPAAATGDATPQCAVEPGAAHCVLRCDAGQQCPDGTVCSDAFTPAVCVWQTQLDTCPE